MVKILEASHLLNGHFKAHLRLGEKEVQEGGEEGNL